MSDKYQQGVSSQEIPTRRLLGESVWPAGPGPAGTGNKKSRASPAKNEKITRIWKSTFHIAKAVPHRLTRTTLHLIDHEWSSSLSLSGGSLK